MRTAACSRLSDAEALRDGRLDPVQRSSYQRHVNGCTACAVELDALEALAAPLRESASDTHPLHVRRERARLLAAFASSATSEETSAAQLPQPPAWALPRWAGTRWVQVASVAVVVCTLLGLWRARPGAPAASAVVHAGNAAVWSTRRLDDREEIALSRGELLIHVEHHATGQPRLRVTLPDGVLEDIGTIFTVSVQNGRTTRVSVQEGSVVLRLRGRPELTIAAGSGWTPGATQPQTAKGAKAAPELGKHSAPDAQQQFEPPHRPLSKESEPVVDAERSSAAQASQIERPRAAAAKRAHRRSAAHATHAVRGGPAPATRGDIPGAARAKEVERTGGAASTQTNSDNTRSGTTDELLSQPTAAAPDPALDFRSATAAFGRGQHREAAAAFAAFIDRHPNDSRAEDAAYLRVVSLQKDGAFDEMRSAARLYLKRYPDALRHAEVARLLAKRETERASTPRAQ